MYVAIERACTEADLLIRLQRARTGLQTGSGGHAGRAGGEAAVPLGESQRRGPGSRDCVARDEKALTK
jgi:hypothetical protein